MDIAEHKELLKNFLTNNPESSIQKIKEDAYVEKPWRDETVQIRLSEEGDELRSTLNSIRLPPQLTAIIHLDTNDCELIYGPVSRDDKYLSRSFRFTYRGSEYTCEFSEASKRLRDLARSARAVGPPSHTDHRHLEFIKSYLRHFEDRQSDEESDDDIQLTSFWIRHVELAEDVLIELIRHLNFYMAYFDPHTPVALIHAETSNEEKIGQLEFASPEYFPSEIEGRKLDNYLLGLWEAAADARDNIRKYLHCYQVLEYAAFYFVRDEALHEIQKLIRTPNVRDKADQISKKCLDILADDRAADEQKVVSLIQRTVSPEKVWSCVEKRREYFSLDHEFDGGFVAPALVREEWSYDDFSTSWLPKLPDTLRKIRNALVHAREQRMAKCIAATPRNLELLRPWREVAVAVANEVILHGPSD